MSQKSEKIISFLPQIQSLEVELGLPEDTKDEELISIEKLMTTNIKNAKQSIRDQQIREAKAEEAANAPKVKEDVVGVPNEWTLFISEWSDSLCMDICNPLVFKFIANYLSIFFMLQRVQSRHSKCQTNNLFDLNCVS